MKGFVKSKINEGMRGCSTLEQGGVIEQLYTIEVPYHLQQRRGGGIDTCRKPKYYINGKGDTHV